MKDRTLLIMLHGSGSSGIEIKQVCALAASATPATRPSNAEQTFHAIYSQFLLSLFSSCSSSLPFIQYLSCIPLGAAYEQRTFVQECVKCNIDLITPTASERPYTPAMRMPMNVWFDRPANFQETGAADPCVEEDLAGTDESLGRLLSTLSQVHSTFQHVFIGGFSMGGCLALHVLRRYGDFAQASGGKLRGLFSLGSFTPLLSAAITQLPKLEARGRKIPIPVLMLHGEDDGMIGCDWGSAAATALLLAGVDVRFQKYPQLDHEICEEQLRDVLQWMLDTELNGQADAAMTLDESKAEVDEKRAAGGHSHKLDPHARGVHSDPDYSALLRKEAEMTRSGVADEPAAPAKKASAEAAPAAGGGGGGPAGGGAGTGSQAFTLEQSSAAADQWCIHYQAPESVVPMLITRPVLACGGVFDVYPDDGFSINTGSAAGSGDRAGKRRGVYCIASTTDPERIAMEIGKRLAVRIDSDGASVNACPMA